MIKKLDIELNYNSGVFNSENERKITKVINILIDKSNEQTKEINKLRKEIDDLKMGGVITVF